MHYRILVCQSLIHLYVRLSICLTIRLSIRLTASFSKELARLNCTLEFVLQLSSEPTHVLGRLSKKKLGYFILFNPYELKISDLVG